MTNRIHADGYSEAIPIDELLEMARADLARCGVESEEAIRQCAEQVVREKLCPCASSVVAIVDALVEEFRKQVRRREDANENSSRALGGEPEGRQR